MNEMMQQCVEMMNQMGGMMGGNMMGGMMGGNATGGGMMAGGMSLASPWYWLAWVLVIAALVGTVAAIVWVIRGLSRSAAYGDTPLAILERRFAAGEISPQQFTAMKRQLSSR